MNSLFKKLQGIFAGEEPAAAEPSAETPPVEPPKVDIQVVSEVVPQPLVQATSVAPPIVSKAVDPQPVPSSVPPRKVRAPQPTTPVVDTRLHSEWMLQQISECAKLFVQFAEREKLLVVHPPGAVGVLGRSDVSAMMLGYKIVNVVYRRKHLEPAREVLRQVRAAMVSLLLKAGRDHTHQLERHKIQAADEVMFFSLEMAEEHLKQAELNIQGVLGRLATQDPRPFQDFLGGLAVAYGDGSDLAQVEHHFAKEIQSLYEKVQSSIQKTGPRVG